MAAGSVKFFSCEKGWGFLVPDDGGEDVFVHKADVSNGVALRLQPDVRVTYDMVQTQKGNGRKACNVKLV